MIVNKKKIISTFIEENFPKEANIVIFGSICNNSYSINSDIDLLIISDIASVFIKELFVYNDVTFDVMIVPKVDVFECIEKDKYLKVYCDIFEKGIIYKQKSNFITNLKNSISNSKINKDVFLRKKNIEYRISYAYKKLFESNSVYDLEIFLSDLCKNIMINRLLDFGISNATDSKHIIRYLRDFDKKMIQDLFELKENFFLNKDSELLKRELNSKFEINNKNYSSTIISNQYALNHFDEDEMVIYFNTVDSLYDNVISIVKNAESRYYIFFVDKNNIHESGVYLVINETNDKIKNSIIPDITQLIENNQNIIKEYTIIFPYQLNVKKYLGIENDYRKESLECFFIDLSRYYNEKSSNNRAQILAVFLIGVILKSNKSKEFISKNISTLLNLFMSKAYNSNNLFSYNQSELGLSLLKLKFDNALKESNSSNLILEDAFKNLSFSLVIDDDINKLIERFYFLNFNIFEENLSIQYSVFKMIFNIFNISDFHKAYIMYNIVSIINKKNEF